jgi:preprotein translocase subunit SecF
MFNLFKRFDYNFDFMSKNRRRIAAVFSTVLILGSVFSLAIKGMNFGLDFTGGTLLEVHYQSPVELPVVRATLEKGAYHGAVVQHFGSTHDVLIRLPPDEESASGDAKAENDKLSIAMLELLREDGHAVEMTRVEFVGPQVGKELVEAGGLAILYTLIGILIYVAFRFEYRFAIGAIVAALHDPILILGFFAITGIEFDLTVLAAILAIVGYSLNDTIVVFDRIRDNLLKLRKLDTAEVMNISINETLSRTIMTSVTTQLAVLSMLIIGGTMLQGFSTALTIGILIGTYSSIYIASPVALALGVSKADLMPVQKEGAKVDDLP